MELKNELLNELDSCELLVLSILLASKKKDFMTISYIKSQNSNLTDCEIKKALKGLKAKRYLAIINNGHGRYTWVYSQEKLQNKPPKARVRKKWKI